MTMKSAEEEFKKQLIEYMDYYHWQYLGTVESVGIDNLLAYDAITTPDSNEFYQFVLSDTKVQTPGGRGEMNLSDLDLSLDVWRKV